MENSGPYVLGTNAVRLAAISAMITGQNTISFHAFLGSSVRLGINRGGGAITALISPLSPTIVPKSRKVTRIPQFFNRAATRGGKATPPTPAPAAMIAKHIPTDHFEKYSGAMVVTGL